MHDGANMTAVGPIERYVCTYDHMSHMNIFVIFEHTLIGICIYIYACLCISDIYICMMGAGARSLIGECLDNIGSR